MEAMLSRAGCPHPGSRAGAASQSSDRRRCRTARRARPRRPKGVQILGRVIRRRRNNAACRRRPETRSACIDLQESGRRARAARRAGRGALRIGAYSPRGEPGRIARFHGKRAPRLDGKRRRPPREPARASRAVEGGGAPPPRWTARSRHDIVTIDRALPPPADVPGAFPDRFSSTKQKSGMM